MPPILRAPVGRAALLGQDRVVGEGAQQALDDEPLGSLVHLGHEVDHRPLVTDAPRAAQLFPQEPARAASRVEGDAEKRARARAHPAEGTTGIAVALLGPTPVGILRTMSLRLLGRYLARHRVRYAAGVVLLLATNACALLIPWVTKDVIDALGGAEGARATRDVVTLGALMVVALALLQALARTASRLVLLGAGQRVEAEIRHDLFAGLPASRAGVLPGADAPGTSCRAPRTTCRACPCSSGSGSCPWSTPRSSTRGRSSRCSASTPGSRSPRWRRTRSWWRWRADTTPARTSRRSRSRSSSRASPTRRRRT